MILKKIATFVTILSLSSCATGPDLSQMTEEQRQQYYQYEAQRMQMMQNSFNQANQTFQNSVRAPSSGMNNVQFCKVNNFGHVQMCYMTLDMCRSSLNYGDTCISR